LDELRDGQRREKAKSNVLFMTITPGPELKMDRNSVALEHKLHVCTKRRQL
jgi:hypothetical protein